RGRRTMPEDERWRGAQESADELVRMGIDPRVLGLAPSTPPSATRSTPQERIPSAPRQDAPRWVGDRAGDISPTHPPRWSVESAAWGALTQAAETTPRWRLPSRSRNTPYAGPITRTWDRSVRLGMVAPRALYKFYESIEQVIGIA